MCKCLGISRQTYYYQPKKKQSEAEIEEAVTEIFYQNRKVYGTRKIKRVLENQGIRISRRKIGRIMKIRGLKSSYTTTYCKHYGTSCNEAPVKNLLNLEFAHKNPLEAIVTDLTYFQRKWFSEYSKTFYATPVMLFIWEDRLIDRRMQSN